MDCRDFLFVLERNWSHVILGIQSEAGEYGYTVVKDWISLEWYAIKGLWCRLLQKYNEMSLVVEDGFAGNFLLVCAFNYSSHFSLRYLCQLFWEATEKKKIGIWCSLPPAYVVRREGNSFTLFVCPHRGGGPGTPPPGGYPGQVPPPPGGYPGQVPPRGGVGVPGSGTPRGGGGTRVRYPPRGGGTRVGQQKGYSLHGGRYASCVHAGGLSCSN